MCEVTFYLGLQKQHRMIMLYSYATWYISYMYVGEHIRSSVCGVCFLECGMRHRKQQWGGGRNSRSNS